MASKSARVEPIYNNEVIRIVMVGKTGAGKSSTANSILGEEIFKSEFSFESVTAECAKADGEVDGQKVAVIDTPGLFDTSIDEGKTRKDVGQSIKQASPGPHIFLVVIKLDRFTEEEKKTVKMIQEIFGEESDKYSMVLFTRGDQLEGRAIEEFLEKSKDLKELVAKCNGQYHVFNNKLKDRSQVSELLKKIRNITEKNGGNHYTNKMFQEAERAIEEEKQRILREEEEKIRKEREEMEREINEKHEQEIRKMKADHKREERERKMKAKQEEKRRKEKADREREEMERKMKEKLDEELRKIKDDREREEKERRMREEHEEKLRKMKAEQESQEMERKMKENFDEALRKIQADERQNLLMAAHQREMDDQNKRLTEMQLQAFRQIAESRAPPPPQRGCVIS